jgi:hypothetical protein
LTAAVAAAWPPHDAGGRTHQPVRRGSQPFAAGEAFFRPLSKRTVVDIMRGAQRLAIESMRSRTLRRIKLRHAGQLTLSALTVLEAMLFRFLDWKSGRCAPTYEELQDWTGLARDTVASAFVQLEKLGVLERLRRFQVVEDPGGKGPQVHQAPNAYRFALPKILRALLGLLDREEAMAADTAYDARNARLSYSEMSADQAEISGRDNIDAALRRLGRALDRRATPQRELGE